MKRVEKDSIGTVEVPENSWWGSQTQRSLENFPIGNQKMPESVVRSIISIKGAAARANFEQNLIPEETQEAIVKACDKVLIQWAQYKNQFPLVIWQTGSGTQTNMNCNEVIAKLANAIIKGINKPEARYQFVHPNDHVNKSQSSNDVFPAAMHIAAFMEIEKGLLPAMDEMKKTLDRKSTAYEGIVKIGRTHLQDATPISLGQEFTCYATQVGNCIRDMKLISENLLELPLGGTAVGTGINAKAGFDQKVVEILNEKLKTSFTPSKNKFASIAAHDQMVSLSGTLNRAAATVMKIANDIRMLGSGPRCGIGELILPSNEPGSSIMPGKVNPTQAEALTMVCAQVMGNSTSLTIGCSQGHFQLNAFKPLIIHNLLESVSLLRDGVSSFTKRCLEGIEVNEERIKSFVENSLMLVTALAPEIGYDKSAAIAKAAHKNNTSLKEEALKAGVDEKLFQKIVNPRKMTNPE